MSTSREWSQRHIEELIKKNGKTDDHLTLVPGTPYINSFCVNSMSPNNGGNWNGNIARTLGDDYMIIRHPGCIEYPIIPVNCSVPVKIANRVLTNDEMNLCSIIDTSRASNQYYYFVDIGGRDIEYDITTAGGSVYDYLRPFIYLPLYFLSDGGNTYLGYAPDDHGHQNYTLILSEIYNTHEYDNISLMPLRRLGTHYKDITKHMPDSFRLRDNSRNVKLDYYIKLGYWEDLIEFYNSALGRSYDFIIYPTGALSSIPSELSYLNKMKYTISGPAKTIERSKLPTNKQIPKDTSIVGIKFYF